jgi:hypothetical protein
MRKNDLAPSSERAVRTGRDGLDELNSAMRLL